MDYTVRVRRTNKYLRLRVTDQGQVVVSAPKGIGRKRIDAFVRDNHELIADAQRRVSVRREDLLPDSVDLTAIGLRYRVDYRASAATGVRLKETGDRLEIGGHVDVQDGVSAVLKRWLSLKAHAHLVPWLGQVGDELDIPFKKTLVRGQKTRWGSCSLRQNISINRNMLFLPSHLVRYVFVHELCHVLRMDHSSEFWNLVAEREPLTNQYRAELRRAESTVPFWAL